MQETIKLARTPATILYVCMCMGVITCECVEVGRRKHCIREHTRKCVCSACELERWGGFSK